MAHRINNMTHNLDYFRAMQVFDVLWSDPQAADGCCPNTLRGAGTYFGPDITKDFLERHNLNLLVRSHECKLEGYELAHNNKVYARAGVPPVSSHFSMCCLCCFLRSASLFSRRVTTTRWAPTRAPTSNCPETR
jgi:diadenosine tetraphosphatase ApaH/serine/threonine PP2A family protein phosphatase